MALQVYGDGVMDEGLLLILTNYHATSDLRRSGNVLDKRLWASPAVWWDQAEPPARVCWLHALQQTQELQSLKASLRRVAVPHTLARAMRSSTLLLLLSCLSQQLEGACCPCMGLMCQTDSQTRGS